MTRNGNAIVTTIARLCVIRFQTISLTVTAPLQFPG
jgi:hypothetical protein